MLWKKFYIILSPVISWTLLYILTFLLFSGEIGGISVSSVIIGLGVMLVFFIPGFAILLFGNLLRKQELKQNIWCLFAIIPDVSLLYLLTGEWISGLHLRPLGHILVGISFCVTLSLVFTFVIYILYRLIRLVLLVIRFACKDKNSNDLG
jgi:hypothetical protein